MFSFEIDFRCSNKISKSSGNPFLYIPLLLLTLLFGCQDRQGQSTPSLPKRVILITCDTLRADRLSCYGYSKETSPNLDRLAGEGIVFKNHYVQIPVTGPSHASIFTGRYLWEHGVVANGKKFPPEEMPLSRVFKDNNYRTVAWVACQVLGSTQGYDAGFDFFFDDFEDHDYIQENKAARQTDQAIAFFRQVNPDDKVFAWIHYFDPHAPYAAPDEFQNRFVDPSQLPYETHPLRLAKIHREKIELSTREVALIHGLYDAEVQYMDSEIGRFVNFLDQSGLLEDTLIIVTADHGEELYEHDYFIEHNLSLYEGVMHSPLIFYWPALAEYSGERHGFTESVDLFPTILTLAGIGVDNYDSSGQNLLGAIQLTAPLPEERTLLAQLELTSAFAPAWSVRKGAWKMILGQDGEKKLFNLSVDPKEKDNLLEENPSIAGELRQDIEIYKSWVVDGNEPMDMENISPETLEALKSLGYVR